MIMDKFDKVIKLILTTLFYIYCTLGVTFWVCMAWWWLKAK